jgi:hypothetical protein
VPDRQQDPNGETGGACAGIMTGRGGCDPPPINAIARRGSPGETDGVDVHQVVRDARTGKLISDSRVRHRCRLEQGLVVRMEVLHTGLALGPPAASPHLLEMGHRRE